jgi:transcriptional regulator PpsR
MAGLQQRLVTAQQSMERDYARLRHVETRYRLLFQVTAEPVVIVDAGSHKVVEANPAAGQLLGEPVKRMVGHPFLDSFDPAALADVQMLLNGVQSTGRADNVRARLTESRRELLVYASLFRQENSSLFLVRLLPLSGDPNSVAVAKAKSRLLEVVESAPDGIVVTGPDGRILTANAAFLDLAQLATEEQARGESLERWLGRPGVDLNVLIANLRQHGSVRLFATILRGEYGASSEIEVSAVSLPNGEQPCFGFTIRGVGRRLPPESRLGSELPRSVEQLTELVGRVPLKDLVRETTDVIERLCIEAALELTRDNRASAAEILGLSRQSLYVKLRRYGLGDLGSDGGDPG